MIDPDLFAGPSDIHARMRAQDWAATLVGPVSTWPQSLRSLVRMLLASRYPMVLTWGPQFSQFYNDAYSALIGDKHPAALGNDIRITLAEGWDTLGPMITEVLRTGTATWLPALLLLLERSGYREEAYFTVSHAPAEDDAGAIVGMLAVCSEVTQQVIGERQQRLLRDLAVAAGEARNVEPACRAIMAVIATHPLDVPFALLYLRDPGGQMQTLHGVIGFAAGHPACPQFVDLARDPTAWQLARAAAGETVCVEDVQQHLAATGGPWHDPVRTALVLPIAGAGTAAPLGVLVAGVSPNRALDEASRAFYDLLAGQVSVTVRNAQAYAEERQRAAALAELDRAKTEFFSNVSHEFRTPLTLLLGPVEELLTRATERPLAEQEQLATIQRNGRRLLKLVNTLLDFSRIEANRMTAVYQPSDLATQTAELASGFRSTIERAGLQFHVDCLPLGEPVYVDHSMWETIVLNLLSNAFKFTFAGTIAIALHREDDHVALVVSDTGAGIPATELPHVFARFHRAHGAHGHTHEGTGIGLALVQALVQLHGGQIQVESAVGQGTAVRVRIPRGCAHLPAEHVRNDALPDYKARDVVAYVDEAARWDSDDVGATAQHEEPAPPAAPPLAITPTHDAGPTQRPRILLADDNADMRAYVQRLLADDYAVVAVAHGRAALELAQAQLPDLIVSDVMMPGMDGVALVQALRADARTATVPVLLLSARAGQEASVEGLDAGADDYLVKPFAASELRARVRTHLALAQLRRRMAEEQALRHAAEHAVRERDTFLTLAAHELRTPLTALQGYAELLERRSRRDDRAQERDRLGAQVIVNQARRLNTLVSTMLDLSRMHTGQFSLNLAPLDLGQLVQRVVAETEPALSQHALVCKLPDAPVLVMGDALRLEQVVHNLIQNAIKYSPDGGTIQVKVEVQGSQASVVVSDEGIGIPAHALPRLFERFYRADNGHAVQVNGLGIGLFVVQEIVAGHGGMIAVRSIEGEGSTFTVHVPLSEA